MPIERELLEIQNGESDLANIRTKKSSVYAFDDTNLIKKKVTGTSNGNKFLLDVSNEGYFLSGTGSNGSVTLTNADTAYAVPATASTKNNILILYNGSDTNIYWGFENSNANGILIPPDGKVSIPLGANQQVYAYCGTAGKVITYSYKEVV